MFTAIVASTREYLIGIEDKDNKKFPYKMPWNPARMKDDISFFTNKTTNQVVVMGKNTYLFMGNVLYNRRNFIFTRGDNIKGRFTQSYHYDDNDIRNNELTVFLVNSTKELVRIKKLLPDKTFYVIGGANLLEEFAAKNYLSNILWTRVEHYLVPKNGIYLPGNLQKKIEESKKWSAVKTIKQDSNNLYDATIFDVSLDDF